MRRKRYAPLPRGNSELTPTFCPGIPEKQQYRLASMTGGIYISRGRGSDLKSIHKAQCKVIAKDKPEPTGELSVFMPLSAQLNVHRGVFNPKGVDMWPPLLGSTCLPSPASKWSTLIWGVKKQNDSPLSDKWGTQIPKTYGAHTNTSILLHQNLPVR